MRGNVLALGCWNQQFISGNDHAGLSAGLVF